ncbi:MAG TPA: DUF3108 domain-containing protein [Gallionella sp.]|nr:DUF3108 domain-containing protein [Gallionella sp.]
MSVTSSSFAAAVKRLLHVCAWLMLCTATAFAAPPGRVQTSYDIYKGSLKVGQIEETFTREQNRYTLTSVTTPVGLLAMFKPEKIFITSSGLIGKQGLQPLRFSHKRENDASRDNSAEFDWENKQLTLVHQAQRTAVALPDGTQDRLSAMYQFMFLPLQSAAALDFPMTNGNKLDNYHYAIARDRKLDTPAGTFKTLYLDNQAKAGESRTEIWLATERNNLPCQMIITESNGDQLTQTLSKIVIQP